MSNQDVPLISVITPTHNRRSQVVRAVKSVLVQTLTRFEHIVVDDGSTDGTAAALAEIRDPRLIYVGAKWRGANAARNAGIERARAPVVTFLDSDDVYLPDRLERTLARFDQNPSLEVLISSFLSLKGSRSTKCINREAFLDKSALQRALVSQTIFIAGSAITARHVSLLAIGGYDSDITRMQDLDLLLRFARRGGAQLSEDIDWKKYNSENSISRRRDGYVAAYANLIDKHPYIADRYPDVPPFMIARQIIADTLKGRLQQAFSGYLANRSSNALGYSLPQLLRGYVIGRRWRRDCYDEFRAKYGPRAV
ncbi:MAG: glycosyltransferase [Mesorhizobium sp.]|uniref:glycosyltransferase family 2 protein n=1 Tax=unclassified Mesorhizobium TaxID=325217 RepID=UPI000F763D33|nr:MULTISPECIES: glycosyltransferase family A protein [unclassified Mesorhizobium]RVC68018.1 glycosyltransferase [Mesorhizobium sp. M00.F.Ca.ET.038.03.1.1]RVC78965.1 glycosyltransferase [Mesorhizobium sp. M2A.F.Ca.ET.046.02.1.1]AZO36505.1 glycosyltransferase family 2 protein [Mesorhizobium sp. M2A.F.Ca.ET.046.03.2.1]RWA89516.1 MAG: glycosyltransferase [Mesorhizobium sp.]RWB45081.1 MAG: glycosyltransferase [Mesorhizobium sp.]